MCFALQEDAATFLLSYASLAPWSARTAGLVLFNLVGFISTSNCLWFLRLQYLGPPLWLPKSDHLMLSFLRGPVSE